MQQPRFPVGITLGTIALFGLAVGMFGGPCGDTLAEQAFSVTAVPVVLVGFGLAADRALARSERRDTAAPPGSDSGLEAAG